MENTEAKKRRMELKKENEKKIQCPYHSAGFGALLLIWCLIGIAYSMYILQIIDIKYVVASEFKCIRCIWCIFRLKHHE